VVEEPRTAADGPAPGVNWGNTGGSVGRSGGGPPPPANGGGNGTASTEGPPQPSLSPSPHARATLFDGVSNNRYPVGCGAGLWLRG